MSTRDVRILLVGDSQVGKTSLILSLVSEEFPDEVPMRAEEITIPADVTPEKVPTHIVDYCEDEQTDDILADEIVKANVVCIVYDVTDEETIERITTFWLPLIRSVTEDEEHIKPVVIVGNKSDLSDTSTMDIVLPIMNDYSEVETCVECSAKNLKNISEMFYYAQKAVLHPTAPLYSPDTKQIKPLCEMALTRIFKISDADGDGILNDTELNSFQKRCFNSPLQGQGLQDVKNVVRKNIEGGIRNGGLTLKGFVFLHTLFIQRGRHETTWAVLRKFGYGEDLQLRSDYLCPKGIDVGTDSTVELSDAGYEFLIDLFNKYDKDQDEALSPVELEELFEMCPTNPWGDEVIHAAETNSKGWITLQGFLAQWTLTTFLDYTRTLAYLAYFGYAHGEVETQLSTAIAVTRSKSIDIQKKSTTRSVFQCYVFGPPGVGKTTFLQSFLDRSPEVSEICNSDLEHLTTPYVINLVEVQRQEKYLVLREIEWENSGLLLHDRRCDVACFLYNSNDAASFSQIVQLRETLPCLFVATKSDLTTVKQEYEQQPLMYTTLNKLPPPQPFSINGPPEGNKKIYSKLAQMAVYP
ncbi:predicted protein [Nematostella vectensis]|uniref:Mitochondrial Rho GTPase n=1 Tax=Nematostella vectensis TaxID=45351 RepID=A7SCK4_NEMVE|nr:predicted protein [Nematostella vectensis]|eukprot:XP_001630597.1 predicted protein [Nematostella vectensis]